MLSFCIQIVNNVWKNFLLVVSKATLAARLGSTYLYSWIEVHDQALNGFVDDPCKKFLTIMPQSMAQINVPGIFLYMMCVCICRHACFFPSCIMMCLIVQLLMFSIAVQQYMICSFMIMLQQCLFFYCHIISLLLLHLRALSKPMMLQIYPQSYAPMCKLALVICFS